MTPEKAKKYLEQYGLACPFCGSRDIEASSMDFEAGEIAQRISCHECGERWTDVYKLAAYPIFGAVHFAIIRVGSIVEAAQVQHAVEAVKQHFVSDRRAADLRLATGLRNANIHFAAGRSAAGVLFKRKGKHISWRRKFHELAVQFAHATVTNEDDGQVA